MLAVIAQLNDYDKHYPYDYRDGTQPEKIETDCWPIYDDSELDHLKYRLEMECEDALSEGIHAVFAIIKIAGVPDKLHFDFPYNPVIKDLFEPNVEVFTNGEKVTHFDPKCLLSFRPTLFGITSEEVDKGSVTKEEYESSQLVSGMWVLENTAVPIADGPYGIEILDLNVDYVIWHDKGFEYHRSEIIDDGFMVDQLRIELSECMRRAPVA